MEEDKQEKIEEQEATKLMEREPEEKNESDKKETKTLLIIIAIIVGIFIIFFAVGYFYKMHDTTETVLTIDDLHQMNLRGEETENNYMYNGFSFVSIQGAWYTQIKIEDTLIDLPIHYGPRDLEDIEISGTINESFMKNEIYITFNPTEDNMKYVALAASELSLSMVKGMNVKPVAACDRNETDIEEKQEEVNNTCYGRPIITCESGEAAVYLLQEEPAKVEMKGNCILVQGAEMNLTKAVDRLLLEWYNVMDYTE